MVDIPDYAALQTRVAQYIDDTTQTARIPGFIEMAEREWDRTLWIPARENVATATATSERIALPTDCAVIRSLVINGFGQVRQSTPNEAFMSTTARRPYTYSLQRDEIVFEPAVAANTEVTTLYYRDLPFLSVAAPSNWLLAAHPDLYLYGTLVQAYAFLLDDEQAGKWRSAHDTALDQIMRYGGKQRYGGGPLIARVS
jgi:hypothetical protein